MAKFILDVLDDKNNRVATLSIYANQGTNKNGFGWEFLGKGRNTGGRWEWEGFSGVFIIVLNNKHGQLFGFINADWDPLPHTIGYPPEPWFSHHGIDFGKVDVLDKPGGELFSWRLR